MSAQSAQQAASIHIFIGIFFGICADNHVFSRIVTAEVLVEMSPEEVVLLS